MTRRFENKTTTWGDCPSPECRYYGVMRYNIDPGDTCEGSRTYDDGCGSTLRWWDRWHDGEHRGEHGIEPCLAERRAA
jgi:hypothetical protein